MKVKITTMQTHEVEVQLPYFAKNVEAFFTDYYAIYSEISTQNIELSIRADTGQFYSLHSFKSPDVFKYEQISEQEFNEAYQKALLTIPFVAELHKQAHGEYYTHDVKAEYSEQELFELNQKSFEAK
jgi:hypothetical protein